LTIPTNGEGVRPYDFTIDWGDGTTERVTGEDPDPSHSYAAPGTYEVQISGAFPRIHLGEDSESAVKLVDIKQWGSIVWESMQGAFVNAARLEQTSYTDQPDLSSVTSMYAMFQGARYFNGDVRDWDVSNVTDMSYVFAGGSSPLYASASWSTHFNGDVSGWDVSSVTDMTALFRYASWFDQPIGGWDVSKVTSMSVMLARASSFNQPIGDWDVSSVTDMSGLFSGAYDLLPWTGTSRYVRIATPNHAIL